jgi:peptidoglycan hydrolase CwlO-like protein
MKQKLIAVQGQLNYDFAVPPNTVLVKDTAEINACNKKVADLQTSTTSLSQTVTELQKKIKSQSQILSLSYLFLGIISFLFLASVVVHILRSKKQSPPPLQENT